jgi:hypothetical protein
MIQLTSSGAIVTASDQEIESLGSQFRKGHFIHLRELLEPSLLDYYVAETGAAQFEDRVHAGIGKELWLRDPRIAAGLDFLVNDPLMLQLVEKIAGRGPVGSFSGRVYRFVPGGEYHDSWHDDLGDNRLVAMSLNLSAERYSGGVLQIRDRRSETVLEEVGNDVTGGAVLFEISEELQHRVTPLHGSAGRTAFAGWFRSQPDYGRMLGSQARSAQARTAP